MPPPETAVERAEELAERVSLGGARKPRMLVIVNPKATTVSDRLKSLVVYALQSRYQVEAVETEARGHATELAREAVGDGYGVVVAFGGDGTVNEAANGLVGSDTPLTVLPGGSTNVFCRLLGIPGDVVEAAEHLLAVADDFRPRRVDAGRVAGRHFFFASGVGLDASVVERIERGGALKARAGEVFYLYAALSTFVSYMLKRPRLRVEAGGRSVEAVGVVAQNADPMTFLGRRPIRICEGAGLETGSISLAALRRATPLEAPTLIPRVLSGRAETVQRHRQVVGFSRVTEARVASTGDHSLPVQTDGEYIGEYDEVDYGVSPRALCVVA